MNYLTYFSYFHSQRKFHFFKKKSFFKEFHQDIFAYVLNELEAVMSKAKRLTQNR